MDFVVKVLAMLSLNILLNCFLALSLNVNAAAILKRDDDQNNYIYANLTDSDNSFLIDLSVGSDSQNVSVIVDTGSSDLWFPSNDNPYCQNSSSNTTEISSDDQIDCSEYYSFNPSNSDTFHKNGTEFKGEYGDDVIADGYYGQDSISIAGSDLPTVNFAVSNLTNSTYGHLGLGYPIMEAAENVTSDYEYTTFLQQLVDDGKILQPAYSLYLNPDAPKILFGAIDKKKINGPLYELYIVPTQLINGDDVGTLTNIAISMNHLSYMNGDNTNVIGGGYYPVVLNSALDYHVFPKDFVDAISQSLNLEYSEEDYYYIDCSEIQEGNFLIAFQGAEFDVPATSFFQEIVNEDNRGTGVCYFNVEQTDNEFITMGSQFLQNFYTVVNLHQNKIGLAYAAEANDEDIEVIENDIGDTVYPEYDDHYGKGHSTFSFFDHETLSFSETASYSAPAQTASSTTSTRNVGAVAQKSTSLSFIAILFSLLV